MSSKFRALGNMAVFGRRCPHAFNRNRRSGNGRIAFSVFLGLEIAYDSFDHYVIKFLFLVISVFHVSIFLSIIFSLFFALLTIEVFRFREFANHGCSEKNKKSVENDMMSF